MKKEETRKIVRAAYGKIARQGSSCCTQESSCCETYSAQDTGKKIGYTEEEMKAAPKGANLGLGCGNPTAIAALKMGEIVLDLGSGAGFDCFLASEKVGPKGRVIGVDMTPEMIDKARGNAKKSGVQNVEFRLGEIESLPVADSSVDVVISNCVINLSSDKRKVFSEIVRVLKPGGRVAISDIALLKELPEKIRKNIEAYVGCVAGAVLVEVYNKIVEESGLRDVSITVQYTSACVDTDTKDPIGRLLLESMGESDTIEGLIVSVYVEGRALIH
jgi:SAM-dependent methyltransferase